MTIKEMFSECRYEARFLAEHNKVDTVIYMSGTKNKKTRLEKLLNQYVEDLLLDYEENIIDAKEFDLEHKTALILQNSLNHYLLWE